MNHAADNSVCEDAYAFTRTEELTENSKKISFIPNYSFYSTVKCSDTSELETIEPPVEYSDDVRDLKVGNPYEYCVKAGRCRVSTIFSAGSPD